MFEKYLNAAVKFLNLLRYLLTGIELEIENFLVIKFLKLGQ